MKYYNYLLVACVFSALFFLERLSTLLMIFLGPIGAMLLFLFAAGMAVLPYALALWPVAFYTSRNGIGFGAAFTGIVILALVAVVPNRVSTILVEQQRQELTGSLMALGPEGPVISVQIVTDDQRLCDAVCFRFLEDENVKWVRQISSRKSSVRNTFVRSRRPECDQQLADTGVLGRNCILYSEDSGSPADIELTYQTNQNKFARFYPQVFERGYFKVHQRVDGQMKLKIYRSHFEVYRLSLPLWVRPRTGEYYVGGFGFGTDWIERRGIDPIDALEKAGFLKPNPRASEEKKRKPQPGGTDLVASILGQSHTAAFRGSELADIGTWLRLLGKKQTVSDVERALLDQLLLEEGRFVANHTNFRDLFKNGAAAQHVGRRILAQAAATPVDKWSETLVYGLARTANTSLRLDQKELADLQRLLNRNLHLKIVEKNGRRTSLAALMILAAANHIDPSTFARPSEFSGIWYTALCTFDGRGNEAFNTFLAEEIKAAIDRKKAFKKQQVDSALSTTTTMEAALILNEHPFRSSESNRLFEIQIEALERDRYGACGKIMMSRRAKR